MENISYEQAEQIAQEVVGIVGTDKINVEDRGNRYYITTDFNYGGGLDFSIPKECNANAFTSVYIHGDGTGLHNHAGGIDVGKVSENNITEGGIVFYPRNQMENADLIKEAMYLVEERLNTNVDKNYTLLGYSAGEVGGIELSKSLANDDIGRLDMIFADARDNAKNIANGYFFTSEDAELFAKKNITVYCVDENNSKTNNEPIYQEIFANHGINTVFIEMGDISHNDLPKYLLDAGIMNGGPGFLSKLNLDVKVLHDNGNIYSDTEKDTNIESSSDEIISSNYEFIQSNVEILKNIVASAAIRSVSNVNNFNTGSVTFSTVNQTFNNYLNKSKEYYGYMDTVCNNLLSIAESYRNLDASLALEINNSFVSEVTSLNLGNLQEFYNQSTNLSLGISGNNDIKLNIADLFEACSENNVVISSLLQDVVDTNNMKKELDNLIGDSSSELKGESWNLIREKLTEFSNLCEQKNKYTTNLVNNIQMAYRRLIEYLQKYEITEADTSMIEELQFLYKEMLLSSQQLLNILDDLKAKNGQNIYGVNELGEQVVIGKVDNSAAISMYQKQYDNCLEVIKELERILEALTRLPIVDNLASTIVSNGDSGLSELNVGNVGITSDISVVGNPSPIVGGTTIVENSSPVVEETPVIENSSPVVENTPPVVGESPATENLSPVVENTSITENLSPAVEETPVVENSSPVVEDTPIAGNSSPVVENTPVIDNSSSVVENTPVIENTPPVVEDTPVIENTPPVVEDTPVVENTPPVVENKTNANKKFLNMAGIAGGLAGVFGLGAYGKRVKDKKNNKKNDEKRKTSDDENSFGV